MIQMTLIQIDNYGPWTVTPTPRNEADLQILQAELYADLQRQFAAHQGLVFFTRFDNMLAVTNGMDLEDHRKIQKSIGNRYPITVSMGVGAAETPYDAQRNASRALQSHGGAQSEERKEVLAIDGLVDEGYVQIAHIDINGITETMTDIVPAYDTSFIVNRVQHFLMKKLINEGALLFFIGGDNFMSPCNGLEPQGLLRIINEIDDEINVALKAGIGKAPTAEKAAGLADLALEEIRGGFTYDLVHVMKE
ncbi:GTP cyclohydrolase IIa [Methanothermobacter thermautotrophicus]|jgi:GTP cyclohydrolase IIa|uniref:GTP cyclohydrolase III n=1 Tax=Methanothermobacter thermautotrophicus TaxID=145262 RepID=A0A842YN17_METTF|nr:GTP cyclohydrolase III [Methanothermobacter thermautotrophicus]MBE2900358.1 GTP cyclohydrolase IIa [Methanothermobacter thermautotrophicus]MCQ8905174.1 GTP cyclohydrolase IIa [Methanothermobacter sp.]